MKLTDNQMLIILNALRIADTELKTIYQDDYLKQEVKSITDKFNKKINV